MLRHLKETGAISRLAEPEGRGMELSRLGLPEGVKEVVGRRLSRLSEACNRVLSVAAAMGREFDIDVLQQVAGIDEDELIEALEHASRAQLVAEVQGATGRFAFTHAFIRETLYGELSSPRRVRLHSRLAEAIERITRDGAGQSRLAELAYHFTQAASAGLHRQGRRVRDTRRRSGLGCPGARGGHPALRHGAPVARAEAAGT